LVTSSTVSPGLRSSSSVDSVVSTGAILIGSVTSNFMTRKQTPGGGVSQPLAGVANVGSWDRPSRLPGPSHPVL
jgi:hypothetical protein